MDKDLRVSFAAVLTAVFLITAPLAAAGGGGGSSQTESSSSDMTYITIGLAALVGGYLIYDAVTHSEPEAAGEITADEVEIIDTGVDWNSRFPSEDLTLTVAVSVLGGSRGRENAAQLIGYLKDFSDEKLVLYEDPIELGSGSPEQKARMAAEYFGADYLVLQVQDSDSIVEYGVATSDSILLTLPYPSGTNIMLFATDIIESDVFLYR